MAVKVDKARCIGCENCAAICATGAIQVQDGKASVTEDKCVGCCACVYDCPMEAITLPEEDLNYGED
ncbi:MAG: 4Fe-4S binding protein [Acidaminococcaceae bacterium]|nr:4Fe-4S binding protein [Acidaminococcaceae bacterium]MBQ9635439.1 4Fe-4S binding protein [Acidaminococcaceae bacterium]MBR1590769.1 4Fe-4S binding protein [Acidaminococcaceae bacterium]